MGKVVVFDMDGLLIDSEKIMHIEEVKALKKYKVENAEQIAYDIIGLNGKDKIKYIASKIGDEEKARKIYKLFGYYHALFVLFHKMPLKPGACEILEYLKDNGYKVAIASALKTNYIKGYLLKTGLNKYTKVYVGGDEVHARKPDPAVYLEVCKILNSKPCDCVAVEDSIVGARSSIDAGLQTIIVPDLQQPDEYNKAHAYKIFNNLFDVLEHIRELDKNVNSLTIDE